MQPTTNNEIPPISPEEAENIAINVEEFKNNLFYHRKPHYPKQPSIQYSKKSSLKLNISPQFRNNHPQQV